MGEKRGYKVRVGSVCEKRGYEVREGSVGVSKTVTRQMVQNKGMGDPLN